MIVGFTLVIIIFEVSYFLVFTKADNEKFSFYECGFDPYNDARNAFHVRFYLVAFLFLFDIETIFFITLGYYFKPITFFRLLVYDGFSF